MGIAISAAARGVTLANILGPTIMIIFLLFGGFYINVGNIPDYFAWLEWTSFVKYAFVAVMRTEFQGLVLRCTESQLIQPGNICPIETGEEVLKNFGMEDLSISTCCAALAGRT